MVDFGPPKPLQIGFSPDWLLLSLFVVNVVLVASKVALRGAQGAPRGPQETLKRPQAPPRAPQEAPRGLRDRPKRLQNAPRRPQEPLKISPRHLRSPKSLKLIKPQVPIPNRRKQKGGRAAVIPLGEVNPPPPEGSERVWMDFEIFFEFFEFKRVQPGPEQSAGPKAIAKSAQVNFLQSS